MQEFNIKKLDEGEEILFVVRKHWFILFLESLFLTGLLILPVLFYFFVTGTSIGIAIQGNVSFFTLGFTASSLLIGWIIFFVLWTDFYLDVWLITNKRIVDIDQRGFFHRDVATLKLDRVQDVTSVTKGILANLIGYGEIRIQSAGTATEFKMTHVPNPQSVIDKILEAQHMYK